MEVEGGIDCRTSPNWSRQAIVRALILLLMGRGELAILSLLATLCLGERSIILMALREADRRRGKRLERCWIQLSRKDAWCSMEAAVPMSTLQWQRLARPAHTASARLCIGPAWRVRAHCVMCSTDATSDGHTATSTTLVASVA